MLLCLSANPRQCMRQVSGNTLQQVETFKYLEVVFTSDRRQSEKIVTRVGKAIAFLRSFTALWQQNWSFQTPQSCPYSNNSLFRSLPRVMNLGNDRRNISEILRCKHQRWEICEESTAWESDVLRLDWARARYKFGASIFKPAVKYFASKYTH